MLQKRTSNIFSLALFIAILIGLTVSGCRKDELNTDPAFRLSFSSDTIMFDTVFTTVGSVTKPLVIHNTSNRKVNVSSVRLAKGSSSSYRINIDGATSFEVKNLEIEANDSIYIFVKVTIDPNSQDSPLINTDSIVFETNGFLQDVKLVAWGQDAHFLLNKSLQGNLVFSPTKPYVIYGTLTIDSASTLTIDAGTKLYFHQNSGLLIKSGAKIKVNGTLEEPVSFRGDHLGVEHLAEPGQWLGIEIEGNSTGNQFTYADIQNGQVGILLDSSELLPEPRLILYNCIIHNMVNYGILSIQSNIMALNCRVTNCGGYTISIEGGRAEFRHSTIANFWNSSSGRQYPALLLSNAIRNGGGYYSQSALKQAYFGNCIISGNSENEVEQDSLPGVEFRFLFDNCLVQTNLKAGHESSFLGGIINEDAKFIDPYNGYFELDTLSPAKDIGVNSVINNFSSASIWPITKDIKGVNRLIDAGPDLGAYERVEH